MRRRFLEFLVQPLGYLMGLSFDLVKNYGMSIVVFTLITKVILLPVSIWVQKNSIKMVKLQPEINRVKAKYFGDAEHISEGISALYKREKYSPMATLIPLAIQIILLLGVIEVIYDPLTYLFRLPPDTISALVDLTGKLTGVDTNLSSIQVVVVNAIQNPNYTADFLALNIPNIQAIIANIQALDTSLFMFDLSVTPIQTGGISLFVPILAGASAWLMCHTQNLANVLQVEQGKGMQYTTMILSVLLSLYLGLFVPAGVGYYWVLGNLFAIVQLYALNAVINPKNYIDYEALQESREELNALINLGGEKKKWYQKDENHKREKADYKRFFSIVNKKIVFYSEGNGFYKYYKNIIEYILNNSNVVIHYICRDPEDEMFQRAENNPQIKAYYIGDRKLITLMMKMDAEIVVMSTPDLENFHLKRSYVKKDAFYIYVEHGVGSTNLLYRKNALAHFDAVCCVGAFQVEELKAQEEKYGTPKKELIVAGYSLLDDMVETYKKMERKENDKPLVLIAPSWQDDNIMDSCLDGLLDTLSHKDYDIIVRPHPQYVRHNPARMEILTQKYEHSDRIQIEGDFTSTLSVYSADILITDWSGIGYEFSFTTNKPTIFINTKMKVMNPEWEELGIEPVDFRMRKEMGYSLEPSEITSLPNIIEDMIENKSKYTDQIENCKNKNLFNIGNSAVVTSKYILNTLVSKVKNKSN